MQNMGIFLFQYIFNPLISMDIMIELIFAKTKEMKMKNLITSLLLLSCLMIFAQDKKSLEEKAAKMIEATNRSDYDALLDHTYPKVFEIAPRDAMKSAMETMFTTEEFTIKIIDTAPNFKFGDIRRIDEGYYSIIDFDMALEMTYTKPVGDKKDSMLERFKTSMGTSDITFDAARNTFKIKKRSQLIGINDAASKNVWTFLSNDNRGLLYKMLGEKVIKELGL